MGISNCKEQFQKLQEECLNTYIQKNKAYGNSFDKSLNEDGLLVAKIRIMDKINRFNSLVKNPDIDTADEALRDTLLDLSNYALMTVMWLDNDNNTPIMGTDSRDFQIYFKKKNRPFKEYIPEATDPYVALNEFLEDYYGARTQPSEVVIILSNGKEFEHYNINEDYECTARYDFLTVQDVCNYMDID